MLFCTYESRQEHQTIRVVIVFFTIIHRQLIKENESIEVIFPSVVLVVNMFLTGRFSIYFLLSFSISFLSSPVLEQTFHAIADLPLTFNCLLPLERFLPSLELFGQMSGILGHSPAPLKLT